MHIVQETTLGIPVSKSVHDIANLQEMAFSHSFALRGVRAIDQFGQRCNLMADAIGEDDMEGEEEIYTHITVSTCFFSTEVEALLRTQGSLSSVSIFSPFPSQVLPFKANETELKEAGFDLLHEA
jgi:hypothetical protein